MLVTGPAFATAVPHVPHLQLDAIVAPEQVPARPSSAGSPLPLAFGLEISPRTAVGVHEMPLLSHAPPGPAELAKMNDDALQTLLHNRHRYAAHIFNSDYINQVRVQRDLRKKLRYDPYSVLAERELPPPALRSPRSRARHAAELRMLTSPRTQRRLDQAIAAAAASSDPAKQLEAATARTVRPSLIRYNQVIADPARPADIGCEIDAETTHAIIESTLKSTHKFKQVTERLQNPKYNPSRKPVIVRSDSFKRVAERMLNANGAVVARSQEELAGFMRFLERDRPAEQRGMQ